MQKTYTKGTFACTKMIVPASLCLLLLLSGCANKTTITETVTPQIPVSKLSPTTYDKLKVGAKWGDLPAHIEYLQKRIDSCNADKETILNSIK